MRTLSDRLRDLMEQRVLGVVPLVVIEIVEDHSVPTLKGPIHLATYPLQKFLGADQTEPELPFLSRLTFPVETMSHLPARTGTGTNTLQRRMAFALVNAPYEGSDLHAWLTDTGHLDRALLSLQVLYAPPDEFGFGLSGQHPLFIDGNESEGEIVASFTGEIDRVVSVGSTLEIQGKTALPVVAWKVTPANADPRDAGLRLPYPLGSKAIVRCVNLAVGAIVSLDKRFALGDTLLALSDASALASSGSGMIGAEAVSWTGKDANNLTGVARARRGTVQADHVIGTTFVELSDIVLGVASFPVSSVRRLYVTSPLSNLTVEVPKLNYKVQYDSETAPGSSGDEITVVEIDEPQVASLLHSMQGSGSVLQQAVYQTTTAAGFFSTTDSTDQTGDTVVNVDFGAEGSWVNFGSVNVEFDHVPTGARQRLRNTFALTQDVTHEIVSIRFDITIDVTEIDVPITAGLRISGIEGFLVGFVDDSVVCSAEFDAIGERTITGELYQFVPGTSVGQVDDLIVVDVVRSEIGGEGGDVRFGVTEVSCTYSSRDTIEESTSNIEADLLQNVNETGIDFFYQGNWTTGAIPKQFGLGSGSDKELHLSYTVDPFNNSPVISASIDFETRCITGEVQGVSVEASMVFLSGWDDLLASVPSITRHDHPENATNTRQTTINLSIKDGATSADLIGAKLRVRVNEITPNVGDSCELLSFTLTMTASTEITANETIPRTADAQIQTSGGGVGLQFFAEVDGPVAPDATYSEASGDLISHPSDLIRYWLQETGGFAAADVDDTTFDAAVTNLVGYVWGFDARNLGGTWEEILLRMGYEARANLCRPSYGDWQMQTALSTFAFPAAAATIDSHGEVISIGKDESEIQTRLVVFYAFDPRLEAFDNRSFAKVQLTAPADAAVITREEEFGRKDADPFFLFCHTAEGDTGATDWRKYQEHELGRFARVMTGRVDHWQGFVLELGDIVTLDLVNGSATESVKARVIETQTSLTGGIVVRFAEVI